MTRLNLLRCSYAMNGNSYSIRYLRARTTTPSPRLSRSVGLEVAIFACLDTEIRIFPSFSYSHSYSYSNATNTSE
jgi:hypothetical protein